jgi:hypothetical protein
MAARRSTNPSQRTMVSSVDENLAQLAEGGNLAHRPGTGAIDDMNQAGSDRSGSSATSPLNFKAGMIIYGADSKANQTDKYLICRPHPPQVPNRGVEVEFEGQTSCRCSVSWRSLSSRAAGFLGRRVTKLWRASWKRNRISRLAARCHESCPVARGAPWPVREHSCAATSRRCRRRIIFALGLAIPFAFSAGQSAESAIQCLETRRLVNWNLDVLNEAIFRTPRSTEGK